MAFLKLVRLPAVFTAFPDVLAGYVLVTVLFDVTPRLWPLTALLAASGLLYMSGMILNDCFDAERDAKDRPERPIPSGHISLKTAFVLGVAFMLGGIFCAMLAGRVAVYAAGFLALSIWLYDGWLKENPVAGCLGMGLCRFLNMTLGMAAYPDARFELAAGNAAFLAPPALLAFYVASVTVISRVEDGSARAADVTIALALGAAGLAASLLLLVLALPNRNVYALGILLVLAALLVHRLVGALRRDPSADGSPAAIRAVVRTGILGIILLDAALIAGHAEMSGLIGLLQPDWVMAAGAGVLALLVPARLLARLMQVT